MNYLTVSSAFYSGQAEKFRLLATDGKKLLYCDKIIAVNHNGEFYVAMENLVSDEALKIINDFFWFFQLSTRFFVSNNIRQVLINNDQKRQIERWEFYHNPQQELPLINTATGEWAFLSQIN